jgi:hypothetical protein
VKQIEKGNSTKKKITGDEAKFNLLMTGFLFICFTWLDFLFAGTFSWRFFSSANTLRSSSSNSALIRCC